MNSENELNEGLTLEEAKETAETVIKEREGWKDFSSEGKRTADAFHITIWREPKTPGGFRMVTVDLKGEIISIESGK
jgi:hypothetical protein